MGQNLRPRVRRIRRLLAEVLVTIHAIGVLVSVELVIRWMRLPRLAQLLGVRLDFGPTTSSIEHLRIVDLTPSVRRQVRCAVRAANAWPFGDGPCLRRSLVTARLLRRHGAVVRLGVAGTGEQILAHAWVEIDGRPLEDVAAFNVFGTPPIETLP